MSKLSELSAAITHRGIEPKAVMRHLGTITAIADVMRKGPTSIDHGGTNYSLTFEEPSGDAPKRRVRVILSKVNPDAEMLYHYEHAFRDQFKAIGMGERPTAELIKRRFDWLYQDQAVRPGVSNEQNTAMRM